MAMSVNVDQQDSGKPALQHEEVLSHSVDEKAPREKEAAAAIEHGDGSSASQDVYAQALKLGDLASPDEIDPLVAKKLLRKIDWRLMPIVSACVFYSHILP